MGKPKTTIKMKNSCQQKQKIYSIRKKNKIYELRSKSEMKKCKSSKQFQKKYFKSQRKKLNEVLDPNNDKNIKKIVLLPTELLKIAKRLCTKITLLNLQNAIKIYDIDDKINYSYLYLCQKMQRKDFKYIYTLSFENRKKIMKRHNLNVPILKKKSKIIFFNLVNFLINSYTPESRTSKNILNQYRLRNFKRFIIPIYEGNEELKYFYFISLIFGWLQINEEEGLFSLKHFSDFLLYQENVNKIDLLFYLLFRIDILFLEPNQISVNALLNIEVMICETIKYKMGVLKLIEDEIKENLEKVDINDETTLTLKKYKYKFNPFDYYYMYKENKDSMLRNIKGKKHMTYDYCLKFRYNYIDSEKKINAFLNILKKILSSNVIREYYEKVKISQYYEFPLDNDKIIEYLWNKVIFAEIDNYWGMTNREGFGIFINRLKGDKSNGLGYGAHTITISHEFIMYSLCSMINTNDGKMSLALTPKKCLIDNKDNMLTCDLSDSDDKFEYIVFGARVDSLTIGGNHFIFTIENWNLSLKDFSKGFKASNVIKRKITILEELKTIKNNDRDIKELFKDINYNNVTNNKQTQSISTRKNKDSACNKDFVS